MKSLGLLGLAIALLLAPLPATASPQHVRLSWCGGDAGTTMCVTWNDPTGGGNQVQYGVSQTLTESAAATSFAAPGSLGNVFEAELTGLNPNTEYQYRVGGSGGAWSETYTFRTGPVAGGPCVPFNFVVLGDGRSQDDSGADPKWHTIMTEALEHDPAFVLNTGDLVKDGDEIGQWKDYLEKSDPMQALVPHFPSIGNHDNDKVVGEGALYNMVFQLPRNAETDTEDFYFVTYGDVIFVSLTTENYKDDNFGLQAAWLDQVLTDNPRRWKFVFFHHPPYTSYGDVFGFELNHPPNEQNQNGALVPIFDKHHVDMVFNGHNHYYERFKPLKGGGGSDDGKLASGVDDGTVYIITGGAGAFTFDNFQIGDFDLGLIDLVCGNAVGSTVCDGRHHFVKIEIDGNELKMTAIATSAQNFETNASNIAIIDEMTITKTDPLECAEPPPPPEPTPEEPAEAEPVDVVEEPAVVEEPSVVEEPTVVEEPSVAEPPPVVPDTGGGGTTGGATGGGTTGGGATGGGTTGGGSTTGPVGFTGGGTGTGGASSDSKSGSDSGGCAAAAGSPTPTGAGATLLLLGLLAVALRTRARRVTARGVRANLGS